MFRWANGWTDRHAKPFIELLVTFTKKEYLWNRMVKMWGPINNIQLWTTKTTLPPTSPPPPTTTMMITKTTTITFSDNNYKRSKLLKRRYHFLSHFCAINVPFLCHILWRPCPIATHPYLSSILPHSFWIPVTSKTYLKPYPIIKMSDVQFLKWKKKIFFAFFWSHLLFLARPLNQSREALYCSQLKKYIFKV